MSSMMDSWTSFLSRERRATWGSLGVDGKGVTKGLVEGRRWKKRGIKVGK